MNPATGAVIEAYPSIALDDALAALDDSHAAWRWARVWHAAANGWHETACTSS